MNMRPLVLPVYALLSLVDSHIIVAELTHPSKLSVDLSQVSERSLSKWSHGVLVLLDKADRVTPSLYVFGSTGALLNSISLKIPDSARTQVGDFDAAPDGTIVACGLSVSGSGEYAHYIARSSVGDKEVLITRVTPYWPEMISLAPDGTVWTVGVEVVTDSTGHATSTNKNANALRQFNSKGNLVFSAAPASAHRLTDLVEGYLVANNDRVGWYSPKNGLGQYSELVLSNKELQTHPGMAGEVDGINRVSGFALTSEGHVFLTSETGGTRTLEMFNRGTEQWESVNIPEAAATPVVRGSVDDSLVLTAKRFGAFYRFDIQ